MKRQWKDRSIGACVGTIIFMVGNFFVGKNNAENVTVEIPEIKIEIQQNKEREQKQKDEKKDEEMSEKESLYEERGILVSNHVEVSSEFVKKALLYQYIEYGLRKYNEDNQKKERYSVDVERNILSKDTEFCMQDTNKEPYKVDLAKEIIPELSNNIYGFEVEGEEANIYMMIDTYNMKIYVYDKIIN